MTSVKEMQKKVDFSTKERVLSRKMLKCKM